MNLTSMLKVEVLSLFLKIIGVLTKDSGVHLYLGGGCFLQGPAHNTTALNSANEKMQLTNNEILLCVEVVKTISWNSMVQIFVHEKKEGIFKVNIKYT